MDVNSEQWWNKMAGRYQERGDLRERPKEYADAAAQIIGGPILELGCAFGQFSKYVPEYITYLGMDVSSELINRARTLHPDKLFVCANGAKLSKKQWGKAFAHVCSFQMLEHFTWPDFDELMKNIEQLAQVSLIFSVPRGMPSKADAKADGHLIGWKDEEDLEKCFTKYGKSVQFIPCAPNHLMGQLFY